MRTLERISQVKAELKFACLFYLHFVSTVACRDKTLPRIQKHVPGEEVFWILERVFGFWKCFVPTSHGNTISPCWWPRPKVFTSVLRTKHSLNANFAKKIVLSFLWWLKTSSNILASSYSRTIPNI